MLTKRYFIVSDIHSFYTEFCKALMDSGFDLHNKNHILLVLGDVFDRGPETIELYKFLKSIPKDRLILVRGNHELLYLSLLERCYPTEGDFKNGTVSTFCQIANIDGVDSKYLDDGLYIHYGTYYDRVVIEDDCQAAWNKVVDKVKKSEITDWIRSECWINYYELDKYIFTHGFIPVKVKDGTYIPGLCYHLNDTKYFEYDPDWRQADSLEWGDSVWREGWKFYKNGFFKPESAKGKILVVGHQPSYYCRIFLDGVKYKKEENIDFGIYYSKELIAIDACTQKSGMCNVMVIDSVEKE